MAYIERSEVSIASSIKIMVYCVIAPHGPEDLHHHQCSFRLGPTACFEPRGLSIVM